MHRACFAALALFLGCRPGGVHSVDDEPPKPAVVEFGAVPVGVRKTIALKIPNAGLVKLAVGAAAATAPFSVDATPEAILPGASGSVQVSFAPAQAGAVEQSLTIPLTGAEASTLTVTLSGTGEAAAPGLYAMPRELQFDVRSPAPPIPQTLTLTNTSDGALTWTATSDASELSLSQATGTIAAHQTAQLTVGLTVPSIPGDITRHLTVSAPGVPALSVPVQIRYLRDVPAFILEPTSLLLRSEIPAQPAPRSFKIRNVGNAQLHWSLDLTRIGLLTVSATAGVLEPGADAEVTVIAPPPPPLPAEEHHAILVDTAEAGSRELPITVQSTPRAPEPQYGASVWPKFHGNNACTGLSSVFTHTTGKLRFATQFGPARTGMYDGTYIGSPALGDDGTIYQLGGGVSSTSGAVVSIDPHTGAVGFRTSIPPPGSGTTPSIESTPTVVASGAVFVMTGSENTVVTHFFKLSRAGDVLWKDAGGYADGFDSAPALGADGTLYVAYDDAPSVLLFGQGDGSTQPAEVSRISVDDRTSRSHLETQSGAIAADGTSYWSANGYLWALSKTALIWRHDGADGVTPTIENRSAPALMPDGRIVFAYANESSGKVTTTVTVVTPQGQRAWQRKLAATTPVVPIGPKDSTYLEPRLGVTSPAVGPDGTIYIGHADGLYALSPADGAIKWHAGSASVASSPAIGADGTIFFGAMDGRLSAVSPAGEPRWLVQTNGQVNSSPAIGADGAVFVASDDGFLYAVE